MPPDVILRITLAISLFVHGAILLQSKNFNPFSPAPKKQEIKVGYIKENPRAKSLLKVSSKTNLERSLSKPGPSLKLDSKVTTAGRVPPPYIEQSNAYKPRGDTYLPARQGLVSKGTPKPAFTSPPIIAIKRKIDLPPIEMAKIDNPSYITYYQIVREKIRRSAYQNYTHNETGKVYISFVTSNDGFIKDTRMIEEKTTANDYLKSIALKSVRDASPFPNFPKELDYPQLSFNIIISFEIE